MFVRPITLFLFDTLSTIMWSSKLYILQVAVYIQTLNLMVINYLHLIKVPLVSYFQSIQTFLVSLTFFSPLNVMSFEVHLSYTHLAFSASYFQNSLSTFSTEG